MTDKRRVVLVFLLCLGALALGIFASAGTVVAAEGGAAESDDDTGDSDDSGDDKKPAAVPADTIVTEQHLTPTEIRALEERLNVLKEQIFDSRAKLKQLRDQLVLGAVSPINVVINHTQKDSGAFRVLSLRYELDGFEIFQDVNTDGHLSKVQKQKLFEGSLLPGEHLLVVDLQYRGRGYGLFSYLNNYAFHVTSRYTFVVDEGQAFDLQVTAYDGGEFVSSLKERLRVKFVREARNEEKE